MNSEKLLGLFVDLKLEKVVEIRLPSDRAYAEKMWLTCSRSTIHGKSCADKIWEYIKKNSPVQPLMEGQEYGEWICIDAGDQVIHLMTHEKRDFYNIERLFPPESVTSH